MNQKMRLTINISLDEISVRFAENVEKSTKVNTSVSHKVHENMQLIECHFGSESTLFTQLEQCENSNENLKERFDIMRPTLNSLDISVQDLKTAESNLIQDLKGFGEKLAEAQIPANNPVLEIELSHKMTENTQLQLQLHEASSKIDSLRQQLCEMEAALSKARGSLTEATAERQRAEDRNKRLEIEKLALQGETARAEERIRQELEKENVALREQLKSEHEQKLQSIQTEKDVLEQESEDLIFQLGGVRDSLVSATLVSLSHPR